MPEESPPKSQQAAGLRRVAAYHMPRARATALGFEIGKPWPDVFVERLAAKLAEAVEPAATADLVRDWVRRGLDADLPALRAAKWDYETYRRWIGGLPCTIGGAEWGPLLARPENIEPLVAERLTQGLASLSAGKIMRPCGT